MPPLQSRSTGAFRIAWISSLGASFSVVDAQRLPRLGGELDRLGAARVDAAALGDERLVVVAPGRAGQLEQPLALLVAAFRVRVGVDEHVHVVERGDQLGVRARAASRCRTRRRTCRRCPTDGEVGRLDVDAELAEVALDRLPGAARGDPHLPCGRSPASRPRRTRRRARSRSRPRPRWRCRRTSRCPCPRRRPGRGRRRRSERRARAATTSPSTMLSVRSSMPDRNVL